MPIRPPLSPLPGADAGDSVSLAGGGYDELYRLAMRHGLVLLNGSNAASDYGPDFPEA